MKLIKTFKGILSCCKLALDASETKQKLIEFAMARMKEPSTIRGLVWMITCSTAMAFVLSGDTKTAVIVIGSGGSIAGALGGLPDK